jgi:hypothetical protein
LKETTFASFNRTFSKGIMLSGPFLIMLSTMCDATLDFSEFLHTQAKFSLYRLMTVHLVCPTYTALHVSQVSSKVTDFCKVGVASFDDPSWFLS